MLRAMEIIKPIYDIKNESITWGEFKKEVLFKTFPEELINKTIQELHEMQTQDLVMIFSTEEESIDKNYVE